MSTNSHILFVAEMKNPKNDASSTQIMTRNLLYGFSNICDHLDFIAIVEDFNDADYITEYYKELTNNIYFVLENNKYKTNVITRQLVWLVDTYRNHFKRLPQKLISHLDSETVLVSQSPGLTAALLCREIKRIYPEVYYVQYWGDPLALSLITPNQYNAKRFILRIVEKKLHRFADKIVYGTESLYKSQLKIFPEIRNKSVACDVSYMPDAIDRDSDHKIMQFGYFGNYYSSIRDIIPLYNAFKNIGNAQLIVCGFSDIILKSTDNIKVMDRIPQSEVENEESKIDIEVCILNRVGVQIPGKIFYHTNTSKHILVLIDGPVADTIKAELTKSHRFIICMNEQKAIEKATLDILKGKYKNTEYNKEFYSPERICKQIIEKLSR